MVGVKCVLIDPHVTVLVHVSEPYESAIFKPNGLFLMMYIFYIFKKSYLTLI
jgi:hypothetical protein